MRQLIGLGLAVFAVATPRVVEAKDELGCKGIDEMASIDLYGGSVTTVGDGVSEDGPDLAFDRGGSLYVFRTEFCMIEKQTRFGSLMGWDVYMDLGGFTHDIEPPLSEDGEESTTGFWFEMAGGMNASVVTWGDEQRPTSRLMLLGGFGINVDMTFVYVGARLGTTLKKKEYGLELDYRYVPLGFSFSDAEVTEHRAMATFMLDFGKSLRVGLGAELRYGIHENDAGDAPLEQSFIGEYTAMLGHLSFRMHGL